MGSKATTPTTPPRRRWRRLRRWSFRLGMLSALGLIGAILLMTQTGVISDRVLPRLSEVLNLDVDAESVYIAWDGQLVLERARFRLRDVDGRAGEFLAVKRMRIGIDWWRSIRSDVHLRGVLMIEPVITVSQSLDDRTLNVGRLILPTPGAEGGEGGGLSGQSAIPTIVARSARLELGEHVGDRYTRLNIIGLEGRFAPGQDADAYEFTLNQYIESSGATAETPGGFRVTGSYTPERIALNVENFSLDRWPPETVPSPVRALFRDLHLQGNVPAASFTYTQAEGITARLDLRGVAMNLPIEPDTQPVSTEPGAPVFYGPPARFMRLYDTEGTITFARDSVLAQVHGRLEDMPYRVTWFHQGTSQNSAFTCDFASENFRIDRAPALLPYAPPVVAERLRDFSGPTATVSTRMTVRRGEPVGDKPGLITVSGQAELREGVAAFEGFPYEFQDIAGTFRFSNDKIELVNITGRSRSGARMEASGLIAPLDDDAQVDVAVSVRSATIDDAMIQAFGERHRDLVPMLFNRDRYAELLAAGLIRTSAEADQEAAELARLERDPGDDPAQAARIADLRARSGVPVFDLGGAADIVVNVHRPYGDETPWQTTIDITLPTAGILPKVFPYPMVARNLKAHINNNEGQLTGGSFHGIAGGRADVTANFTVPLTGNAPPRPDISISAAELPIDGLLLHALPGDEGRGHKRLLRDLNISGAGAGSVRIVSRPSIDGQEPEPGFDADFRIRGGTASPHASSREEALGLRDVDARLQASETQLSLDLTARAARPELDATAGGIIEASVRAHFAPGDEPPSYAAQVNWPELPIDMPLETLIRPFSIEGAAHLASARAAYRPAGRISAAIAVESHDGEPRITAELMDARDLEVDLLDGRARISESSGTALISTWPTSFISFNGFRAPLYFEGEHAGLLSLGGQWPLSDERHPFRALLIGVRNLSIEGPLAIRILEQHAPPHVLERVEKHRPTGIIDAGMALVPGDPAPAWRGIRIEPREVSFDVDEVPITLSRMSGTIELEPGGSGLLRELAADGGPDDSPLWNFRANAAWGTRLDGSISIRSEFTLGGRRLSPDLDVLLPAEVRSLMDELSLELAGPFELSESRLNFTRDAQGRVGAVEFSTDARFRDAALEAGLSLAGLTGRASGRFERAGATAIPSFQVDLRADSFTAAGISMTDGIATVASGDRPGEITLRNMTAEAHDGRIAATADILPDSAASALAGAGDEGTPAAMIAPRRQYTASVQLSGVRFNPILAQFLSSVDEEMAGPEDHPSLEGVGDGMPDTLEIGDISRGLIDAQLAISGTIGDPRARRGRGAIRISGGRVMSLPVVLTLIEVSNLQLPVNARLDYASADFYIDGGMIIFNDVSVYSKLIEILGQGTMTWPGQVLDMRFDTRSARPIPLLSQIVKGIRDELVTTVVRGKLGQHEVRLQQLPSSRRMLGIGPPRGLTPAERQDDLQQRSQSGADLRERGGSFGPGIAPTRSGGESR